MVEGRGFPNDKLRRLALASSKAVQVDAQMVKGFKRKFREHDISYASYKNMLYLLFIKVNNTTVLLFERDLSWRNGS